MLPLPRGQGLVRGTPLPVSFCTPPPPAPLLLERRVGHPPRGSLTLGRGWVRGALSGRPSSRFPPAPRPRPVRGAPSPPLPLPAREGSRAPAQCRRPPAGVSPARGARPCAVAAAHSAGSSALSRPRCTLALRAPGAPLPAPRAPRAPRRAGGHGPALRPIAGARAPGCGGQRPLTRGSRLPTSRAELPGGRAGARRHEDEPPRPSAPGRGPEPAGAALRHHRLPHHALVPGHAAGAQAGLRPGRPRQLPQLGRQRHGQRHGRPRRPRRRPGERPLGRRALQLGDGRRPLPAPALSHRHLVLVRGAARRPG